MNSEQQPEEKPTNVTLEQPDNETSLDTQVASPVVAPVSATHSSAGLIVLQWLTYAFWGWLIFGLAWLLVLIFASALNTMQVDESLPYALAATFVLLPIAFTTDLFYRKREPSKKQGIAAVIMVIHAVIFALLGIGALIIAVFTGLSLVLGTEEVHGMPLVVLYTLISATLLYTAAFLRTLSPWKDGRKQRAWYAFGMLAISLILVAFAFIGPVVQTVKTRNDRRIEQNLPSVSSAIERYVVSKGELPESINMLQYDDATAELVGDGLVRYEKVEGVQLQIGSLDIDQVGKLRYRLCVTYEYASFSTNYQNTLPGFSEDYLSYLIIDDHPAGEVCYKLYAVSHVQLQ